MIEVRKTLLFEDWRVSLGDPQARLRVQVRIDRLAFGNPGQHRVLAGGVCEMKIDHGPGYRVYYTEAWRCLGAPAVRGRQGIATIGHQGRAGIGEGTGELTWH